MDPARRMWLGEICCSAHQLELCYGIDELAFQTTLQYGPEVDFKALGERYGATYLDKLLFHIVAFEANKILSLGPLTLDPGRHATWFTPDFIKLWQTVNHKVWAQWRYEHNRPDYHGPSFEPLVLDQKLTCLPPVECDPGKIENLVFCGGGKDSLVAMKLMEGAKIPFSTFTYTHSIYGSAESQSALIEKLMDTSLPISRHKLSVNDTFLNTPIDSFCSRYQIHQVLAAETPASIFSVLPLVLVLGYRHIILAHERSADKDNLVWNATGEDVNHQCGKSLEAEILINKYIQEELISGIIYFSLLKPIHDVIIFSMLEEHLTSVLCTHSCNIIKPWCKRCAKCAYVWLNYMAYLPIELVNKIFNSENLLDLPENQISFRQMLGLEAHTPFECIGQISEVKLAFELVRRKGVMGTAMTTYTTNVTPIQDWSKIIAEYARVVTSDARNFPPVIAAGVLPLMKHASQVAQKRLMTALDLSSES
ncbi:unnamed protein product [Rotaria socialis]|uniref:UDP-N-acetyl-alpha-D-muramoyl-L-alanyl-L-glutamate epimerase n=2 Tax=Rotaria socialis TaxID=392032 RepID=A0A821AD29_9BILA|nr:unnamed protein product [Rotaria socialis]CAF4575308.1 unnamed protein product [Rotaria socialis]